MERDNLSSNPSTQSKSSRAWVILEWPDAENFDRPPLVFANAGGEEADERILKAIARRWTFAATPHELGTPVRKVITSAARRLHRKIQGHFLFRGSKDGNVHNQELEPTGV